MLHILLLILKIIGIILLCILGILILSVLSLLFVPVRYRIEAVRKEGEGEPPAAVRVKVTWLLHFINVLFRYAGEISLRARVTIITIFRYPKREKSSKRQRAQKKSKTLKEKKGRKRAESTDREEEAERARKMAHGEKRTDEAEITGSGTAPGADDEQAKAEDTAADSAERRTDGTEATVGAAEPDDGEDVTQRGQSIWDKIRAFWEKILAFLRQVKDFFTNIQYTIRQFCDKIESVQSGVAIRYEVLTSDQFREVWESCRKELGKVLRSLKPKKLEADIIVGMDDPAATGEILAVCGMLYPLFGGYVNVTGDFEQKRLEGRFFMKGKVSSFRLLWAGWKLYRNKKIRNVYRLLKEGGSVNG